MHDDGGSRKFPARKLNVELNFLPLNALLPVVGSNVDWVSTRYLNGIPFNRCVAVPAKVSNDFTNVRTFATLRDSRKVNFWWGVIKSRSVCVVLREVSCIEIPTCKPELTIHKLGIIKFISAIRKSRSLHFPFPIFEKDAKLGEFPCEGVAPIFDLFGRPFISCSFPFINRYQKRHWNGLPNPFHLYKPHERRRVSLLDDNEGSQERRHLRNDARYFWKHFLHDKSGRNFFVTRSYSLTASTEVIRTAHPRQLLKETQT